MTLRIVVNGTDFTAKWRPYESRWTQRGWQGESAQSEFVFDDPNEILHADFATRKIVEVWEDASGSDVCMYRGRIANKGLGMGPSQVHPDMRWTLFTEDYNKDLEGIRIENAVRPDETDEVRVESIRTAFLNGAASTHASKRPTTELGNTYLGGGDALNMLAETYTDTSPMDMLNRIVELTGRVFFVTLNDDGTGELYYGDTADMSYASDIALTDRGEADGADGVDLFAVYKSEQAGDHAGQNVITGGAIRYGDGSYYEESNIGGAAATYDKWEETYFIDDIPNDTVAEQFLHHIISKRDETNTYFATIDMRAQDAHRIRAGMMVDILRKRANRNTTGQARAVVVTHEPVAPDADGNAQYRVIMEIGRPQFTRVGPRVRRRIPRFPADCDELGALELIGAACDNVGTNPASDNPDWVGDLEERVEITAASAVQAGHTLIAVCSDVDEGHSLDHTVYDEQGNTWTRDHLSSVIGSADVRAEFWRCNVTNALSSGDYIRFAFNVGPSGTGSSEAGARCIGVYAFSGALSSPSTGTGNTGFSSTASLSSTATGDITFAALAVQAGTAATLTGDVDWTDMVPDTAVSGSGNLSSTILGQYLLPGQNTTWTVGLSQNLDWTCTSVAYDAEPCEHATQPIGDTDATDDGDSDTVAHANHVHPHGNITTGGPYHMAEDVTIADSGGFYAATTVEAALQEIGSGVAGDFVLVRDGGQEEVNTVAASGSTETLDLADGNWHDITLNDDCTFTITGFTAGVGCTSLVKVTQDGTGGHAITWDASVIFAAGADDQPAQDADAVSFFLLVSNEGDTVIYGFPVGAGSTDHGALTGLTDDDHTQYLKETDVAAKGDLYAASANDTVGVLSVGSNGQVLTADSGQSLGVKWATPSRGGPPSILLESGSSVPFTFDEILQESDGSDFLWASE